jgi:alkylation response protein AidB-like acyl-CoA dehydrogenase
VKKTALEEFAIEASALKVASSEMLDYVVDENVQIHGGNGFVRDYAAERHYRDARVNRIFEGTNEINRLLVPGRLLRRAMGGSLPVLDEARAMLREAAVAPPAARETGFLAAEAAMVRGAKRAALLCLGQAVETLGARLHDEQEVLGHFADVAMETYAMESAVLRARKTARAGGDAAGWHEPATRCFVQDAMDLIEVRARRLLAALQRGEALRASLLALGGMLRRGTADTVALRRRAAALAVERGGYPLA